MQTHRKRRGGPSKKHATYVETEEEYDDVPSISRSLPKFNFDGTFDYGDAWRSGKSLLISTCI
jgi:hypothetical protein